jgi:hypothetical protein
MLADLDTRQRFFVASCVALIATAMTFAVRGDIMGALQEEFLLTKEELGWIASTAFWGFTLSIVFGGPLCDFLGMRTLLRLAFLGHVAGIAVTVFAEGFWMLFFGTLAIGLANGFVEAACNPLIATIYADQKTHKLNQFHVWFPGGIVVGGLLCWALTTSLGPAAAELDPGARTLLWQLKMSMLLLPTLFYGWLFTGMQFPPTERVAGGVTAREMVRECGRPLFLLMLCCMLLTAATELGPNQWIPNILTTTSGVAGILVLVFINGIMALGRQFAGPVVHRLSPTGMLLASAALSGAGLWLLGNAGSAATVFGAAAVFALGICYFWPTMLGFVAERLPRTGALGLAMMGGAGMLSVSIVLPTMGRFFDQETSAALPTGTDLGNLRELAAGGAPEAQHQLAAAEAVGGAATLHYVVALPVALCVVFAGLWLRDRRRGGSRAETRATAPAAEPAADEQPLPR